jgi:hypothetical protein
MKNDSTTTFLNFVLIALVILGVLFALMSIWKGREARHMQVQLQLQLQRSQATSAKAQLLLNDVMAYNAKANNPELTQIIRDAQTPPAPAK